MSASLRDEWVRGKASATRRRLLGCWKKWEAAGCLPWAEDQLAAATARALAAGLKPSSQATERATWLSGLRFLGNETCPDLLAEALTQAKRSWPKPKRARARAARILLPEEVEEVASRMPGLLGDYVRVAYATGLRIGTVIRLQPSWFSMSTAGPMLTVPAEAQKTDEELYIPWPFDKDLLERLAGHEQDERGLRREFAKACRATGLAKPYPCLHDLRKSWLARLAATGAPMHVAMRLGGWKNAGTMLRHYFQRVEAQASWQYVKQMV